LNGFSFCILTKDAKKKLAIVNLNLDKTNSTPQKQLDFLKKSFDTHKLLQQKFDSISVSHSNDLSTLVPKPFFNTESLNDYLNYNIKVLSNDYITYDEITIAEMVNVYIPFVHLNNFLFDKFGSFEYKHSATILIELLLATCKNDNQTHFFVHVEDSDFQIIVIKNKELIFYNNFTFKTKEDFIYYILFTSEQLKMNPEEFVLTFLGAIEKKSELYDIVYKYIRHIDFFTPDYQLDPKLEVSNHSNIILLNQH